MNITLVFDNGIIREAFNFDAPEHLPTGGDYYEVIRPFKTLKGEKYQHGDLLRVVGRTEDAPFNRKLSIGNLIVKGKDGEHSIWTNLEWMIMKGMLRLQVRH